MPEAGFAMAIRAHLARRPYHRVLIRERKAAVRTRVRQAATLALYAAMLLAVLALWNNDAPSFIYVAF